MGARIALQGGVEPRFRAAWTGKRPTRAQRDLAPGKAWFGTLAGPLHGYPGGSSSRARASPVRLAKWRLASGT